VLPPTGLADGEIQRLITSTDSENTGLHGTIDAVVTLRLFAQARESAGTRSVAFSPDEVGGTVGDVLDEAVHRFGDPFAAVLAGSKVWLNGSPAERATEVSTGDEVAVLPPVSGG
jgi:MoaD family protein